MLLQAVTNDQINVSHCAQCTYIVVLLQAVTKGQSVQGIPLCCCKLLQKMAKYRLHCVRKVCPSGVARCYKWPDNDSNVCARYIQVVLQTATDGQMVPDTESTVCARYMAHVTTSDETKFNAQTIKAFTTKIQYGIRDLVTLC